MRNAQELIGSKLAGLLEDSQLQQQPQSSDVARANAASDPASPESSATPVSPRANHASHRNKQSYRILALIVHILMAAAAALGVPYALWISAASSSAQEATSTTVMILQPLLQVIVLHVAAHASWAFAKCASHL